MSEVYTGIFVWILGVTFVAFLAKQITKTNWAWTYKFIKINQVFYCSLFSIFYLLLIFLIWLIKT